jgi:hypothetical protein
VEYFFCLHLLATSELKIQKPDQLSLLKGNPAILVGPAAFRPHLAMGLAFTFVIELKNKKSPPQIRKYRGGLSGPWDQVSKVPAIFMNSRLLCGRHHNS